MLFHLRQTLFSGSMFLTDLVICGDHLVLSKCSAILSPLPDWDPISGAAVRRITTQLAGNGEILHFCLFKMVFRDFLVISASFGQHYTYMSRFVLANGIEWCQYVNINNSPGALE